MMRICCVYDAEGLVDKRCTMWDTILDYFDVHTEARLLNMEDADIIQVLLGKRWDGYKCVQDMHHMVCTVSSFLRDCSIYLH